MFSLANSELEVLVLDPVADRDRMGTRYCTGGYIFQITDAAVGELLTGPTYSHGFNVFDGQGIPDSFARGPLRDPKSPSRAIVIGIGVCDLAADAVVDPCEWVVDANGLSDHSPHVSMSTQHELASFAMTLRREVELVGRTVRSRVYVKNTGKVGFQICWFPHPFFPHPVGDELCRINAPVSVTDGAGYKLSGSGFIVRDNWQPGRDYYLALEHGAGPGTVILQRHPALGLIAGSCTYAPRFFPIWGNENTFSWEPYFENSIAVGQELTWGLDYAF